jgi:hypothetical protein
VQEGRRQKAGGRGEESLYSKIFNLFDLVGYFRHAVLGWVLLTLSVEHHYPVFGLSWLA